MHQDGRLGAHRLICSSFIFFNRGLLGEHNKTTTGISEIRNCYNKVSSFTQHSQNTRLPMVCYSCKQTEEVVATEQTAKQAHGSDWGKHQATLWLTTLFLTNCWSIVNTIHELRLLLTENRLRSDGSALAITEWWLHPWIPDAAMELNGLTLHFHDRNKNKIKDHLPRITTKQPTGRRSPWENWCQENHLLLNVSKTKELIVDLCGKFIGGSEVERVDSWEWPSHKFCLGAPLWWNPDSSYPSSAHGTIRTTLPSLQYDGG